MLGLNSPNRKAQPSSIYLVQYGTPAQFLDYLFLNDWWINLAVTLISPGQSHLPWSWYRWLPQPRCWKPWRVLLRLWPLWAVMTKAIGQFTRDHAAGRLKAFWLLLFSAGQWVDSNLLTTGLLLPLQNQPCDSAATTPGLPWDQHVIHSQKPLQQGLWQLSLSHMLSQGYLFHMAVNNLQHNLLPAYIADSIQSFHLHIY